MTKQENFVIKYLIENGRIDIRLLSELLIKKFGDKESRGLLANLIDSGCIKIGVYWEAYLPNKDDVRNTIENVFHQKNKPIENVAKQCFKNPLYVCTEQMNDHVKRHINKNINMLTHTQIRNRRNLLGKSFDCVIIDNASFIDEGEIKETLENKDLEVMSLKYRHFLYILIG